MHNVMIHSATYDNCREAVQRAFDLFPLPVTGKKVLIKPNVLRASDAAEGITTHPAILAAVIDCLEPMNPAAIVVGDNPGVHSYGANEASFRQTGLLETAGKYYRNIGNDSVKVDFNPEYADHISVSRDIMEADLVISLPKFKTHGLTVMTGAIKNSYGILPGAQKAMLHKRAGSPERFHEMVVDVFRLRVPDLFIVDAVVGMEGNGPASPELRTINRILASDNAVALDGVMARMMGAEPDRLRFLQRARELDLGDFASDSVDIVGALEILPNFKLPPLGGEAIAASETVQQVLHNRTLLRPKADPDACTACETCVDQCPVGALSMQDNLPIVDTGTCITCFCCQEICPEQAITLQET